MSQVKHFAVYNQETNRNTPADDAIVSERALHEIYLPAFWAAVAVGDAPSVMCAYSTVNGVPACENKYLIGETLDQRWGFAGFVSSDYGATKSTEQSVRPASTRRCPTPVLRPRAGRGRGFGQGRGLGAQPDGVPDPHRDVPVR